MGMWRAAAVLVSITLAACASTRAFDPPPEQALDRIVVDFARGPDASIVTLRNGSSSNAQYLFPLFACSRTGGRHDDANPRQAARFAAAGRDREIWERTLAAGAHESAELSRAPCSDPRDRAGVYFKFEQAGAVSYRVVWSAPVGEAPAGL